MTISEPWIVVGIATGWILFFVWVVRPSWKEWKKQDREYELIRKLDNNLERLEDNKMVSVNVKLDIKSLDRSEKIRILGELLEECKTWIKEENVKRPRGRPRKN